MPELRKENDLLVLFDRDGTIRGTPGGEILPGVRELFSELKKRNVSIGVVTGGSSDLTASFLEVEGLSDMVSFVISEVDGNDRYGYALSEVEKSKGMKFNPKKVCVIDDDYTRVKDTRAVGMKFIGVATGFTGLDQFQNLNPRPNAFFKDLSDTNAVIDVILGKNKVQKREKSKSTCKS